jgi:hypothetical protein
MQKAYAVTSQDRKKDAVDLYSETIRVRIAREGSMVPKFNLKHGPTDIDAHWLPHFRDTTGKPYDQATMGKKYLVKLLYILAGNFLCAPNFGSNCKAYGKELPVHGPTSEREWTFEKHGDDQQAAYLKSTLDGILPLKYTKFDIILRGQPIHYSAVKITNTGNQDLRINIGWHNTIGDNPGNKFLEKGCIIDLSADRYATPPEGGEFDDTGMLKIGAEFNDLTQAPTRNAGVTFDLRNVPGMIGFTDLISGAIPDIDLGWSSVVNPNQGLVYATFFRGPSDQRDKEINLFFNSLWLQYGGRNFEPWCDETGKDVTFCLGTENSVGYFANGLEEALQNPTTLGRPTTFEVKAGETKTLYYGTMFAHYMGDSLALGVKKIEKTDKGLTLVGQGRDRLQKVDADSDFKTIAQLVSSLE